MSPALADHARAGCVAAALLAAVACPAAAQPRSDIVSLPSAPPQAEALAASVAPGVVQVVASAYGTTRGSGLLNLQRLVGAGAIVDDTGLILTSAHLLADAMQVDVVITSSVATGVAGTQPPRVVSAALVGIVADLDLAVLRVSAPGLSALRLSRARVRPGDRTLTVGPGKPGEHVLAEGVVLAAGAPVREDAPVPYLITDAAQSVAGAPVINERGEMIGLASAFVGEGQTHDTATVALPAALLENALAQVTSPAPWHRGVIGLTAHRVESARLASATNSSQAQLVVAAVAPGLPAERAGVRSGDVIVSVNRQPVDGMELSTLYLALYTLREGQSLHLGVERDGQLLDMSPMAVSVRDVLASQ
jgi:S1-C subfamily serine protease